MKNDFFKPKLDYNWSDFYEVMQDNPIVYHVHTMMLRGDIKTTEQMLIGCVCMLVGENETFRERIINIEMTLPKQHKVKK